ncbi:MAG: rhomboid family intramembrane serine protease [Phycisphaeraceae bacterium]|nr:rhomboid family intramembrane serine protease [Phycisphaeraceae bacterium]
MGIADRDYARNAPDRASGPRMSTLSFNTLLIILNISVFILGRTPVNAPVEIRWGTAWNSGVPREVRQKGVTLDALLPVPGMRDVFYRPIVTPITGPEGQPVRDLTTGQPVAGQIGQERWTRRPLFDAYGHFSTGKALVDGQVWRFLTFQFLHADVVHLMFNMLGLWFFGGLVEQFLGRKRYLVFYLACGVFGAVTYLLLNLVGYTMPGKYASYLPFLLVNDPYTPLIGASAGVFGVLMAAAYIAPKAIVDVMFVLPMRLKTAVYIFLGLAVLNLFRGGSNAGGDAAHVGGAIAGYYCIRNTHVLRNILGAVGLGERGSRRGNAPGNVGGSRIMKPSGAQKMDAEVDRILEKVKKEGLSSLTAGERSFLKQASKEAPDF